MMRYLINLLTRVLRIHKYLLPAVFIIAVFSLIWRDGNVLLTGLPKLFEILIIIVAVLILVDLSVSKDSRAIAGLLWPIWKFYGLTFGALSLFILIGHASSVISIPEWVMFKSEVYFEYARIAISFLVFLTTTYVIVRYKETLRWSLLAISISPMVLFAAFLPRWQEFFVESARLIGARNDPNYLATFLALGLIIAASYFLYRESNSRWFGLVYILMFSPLFLWAHSRAAFISLSLALIILSVIYVVRKFEGKRLGRIGLLGFVFILSMILSFFVLPSDAQFLIYRRSIAPVFQSEGLHEFMADLISDGDVELHAAVLRNIPTDTLGTSRGALWRDALSKSTKSPLGFGPAYHNWNPIVGPGGSHSLWLEVALTAGWGGLVIWLVLLVLIGRSAWRLLGNGEFVGVALAISFLYLLMNGFFLNMFTLRWLWLIMGMIVGYSFLKNNEKNKSISTSSYL